MIKLINVILLKKRSIFITKAISKHIFFVVAKNHDLVATWWRPSGDLVAYIQNHNIFILIT